MAAASSLTILPELSGRKMAAARRRSERPSKTA
jgi:hypothetical protein